MASFFKDTFVTFGSRLITVVLGVGLASASAWLLGPEGRGELAIYVVFGTLLALATSAGVEMAGAYYAGTGKYRPGEVVSAEILIIAISTVISIAAAHLLWSAQPAFITKFTYKGLLFALGYVPTMLAFHSFWHLHAALGNTLSYCWGNILNIGFALAGILILCWRSGSSQLAMLAWVISNSVVSIFLLAELARKQGLGKPALSWRCIRDLYVYGIKYYFARMAQFLNVQIGTIVISFLGSKAEIGFFSSAIGLVSRLFIMQEVLSAVLISRVVKYQQDSVSLTARTYRLLFWILLFLSLLLAVVCKPLVKIVLSPKFLPVVVPVWFLLPGIVLRSCTKILNVHFNGLGKPGINSVGIVCAVIVNVILMCVLLPKYSVTGAAMAATAGYVFDAIVLLLYYKFAYKHSLAQLVPRISDIKDASDIVLRKIARKG